MKKRGRDRPPSHDRRKPAMIDLVTDTHHDLAAGVLVEKRSLSDIVEWDAANPEKISKACEAVGTTSPTVSRRRPTKRKWPEKLAGPDSPPPLPTAPDPWRIHFFQRHEEDNAAKTVPGRSFLADVCPDKVRMTMLAVLKAVAEAPPPQFSGGGKWKAMHDDMAGWHEVTVNGPNRHHYRLFCLLEKSGATLGLGGPSIVIVTGLDKPFQTTISPSDYAKVRALGDEYSARTPRSIEPPRAKAGQGL